MSLLNIETMSKKIGNFEIKWSPSFTQQYPREFKAWLKMFSKCYDSNDPEYHGGCINVCEQWRSFKKFIKDMGAVE